MDRQCASSWIGSHENFQAREYDVGASQASQCGDKRQLEKHPTQILKMLCNDNEIIKRRGHLYNINGP
jgi:ribosomal protein L36